MTLILVATDGSDGADRAVDYAAHLAKAESAELLIVNVIGGYGLPDKVTRAFTHAQNAWLEEMLQSLSAQMLTKARDRVRGAGVGAILLEFAEWRRGADDHRHRTGEVGGCHRRRQARHRAYRRAVARQRLAKARKPRGLSRDRRSLRRKRRSAGRRLRRHQGRVRHRLVALCAVFDGARFHRGEKRS